MVRLLHSIAYFDHVRLRPRVVVVAALDAIVRLLALDAVGVVQVVGKLVEASRMRRYGRAESLVLAFGVASQTCRMSDLKAIVRSAGRARVSHVCNSKFDYTR